MERRRLGNSGLEVSALGLGCNNLGGRIDRAASVAVVRAALDHGVTFFDTAEAYPIGAGGLSEDCLGEALGRDRVRAVIATKFGYPMASHGPTPGGSRAAIVLSVERSLRRLRTDWIDLLQMHRPDPLTPPEETLRALDDLIRAGKLRYIGCSNFAGWQVVEAHWIARSLGTHRFVAAQEHYSLLARGIEAEVIPALDRCGMGLIPFFPLAGGALTGKYAPGEAPPPGTRLGEAKGLADLFLTAPNLARIDRLRAVADRHGRALADLAFGWLLAREIVGSVIAGARSPAQVAANAASAAIRLSPETLADIAAALD